MSAFTYEETPTEASWHSRAGRSIKASCTQCDYWILSWLPNDLPSDFITRDHAVQHEPGRALDIDVDWVVSANCSVCDDGIGSVEVDADRHLECTDCGTCWSIKGKDGRRQGVASDD